MNQPKSIPWYIVYHQIALQLHDFYKKNANSSGEILFSLVNSSSIYKKHNSWLSNIKRIRTASLEPIQLFVSFSRSRQKENIRIEIINELSRLLKLNKKWDNINFDGCPTPVALKLQYVRPTQVQLRIWQTFDSAMKTGKKALTQTLWDEVKEEWRGIQIPSFTIFLFWINCKYFLPMDKNTRQYFERSGLLKPNSSSSYDVYTGLLNNSRIKNYSELSLEAYYFINHPKVFKKKYKQGSLISAAEIINTTFRLVGLRTLTRNSTVHKILMAKQYYPFDYTITPVDGVNQNTNHLERFSFKNIETESLYDLADLKINITAIVGKNGSGKSTLLDLLLMGIYSLSIELGYLNKQQHKVLSQLNFEIYWHTDTLYKLVFAKEIVFYEFKQISNESQTKIFELNSVPIEIGGLKENFFYSILVNYSHYALNSTDYKIDWITPLSHKNDGYITPVVINPKRTEGDININIQRDLLNMRFLLNLLELHDADIPEQSFRYIDNGKFVSFFSATYDKEKQNEKIEQAKQRVYDDPKIVPLIFNEVVEIFGLNNRKIENIPYINAVMHYLFNKMFTIVEQYDKYKIKYKDRLEFLTRENVATTVEIPLSDLKIQLLSLIDDLLEDIKIDTSHITLKFKQIINYLKYPELRKILNEAVDTNDLIDLDAYNLVINKIINQEDEVELTIDELLPPAIFKLDFYLDDPNKSSFSKASSGEYQFVSVLSSILYHIRNIDSVDGDNRYNYITVLLDEIELYFHPNMQRFFIKRLLDALSKLDNELYGIHVLFATHSPFILSDIQQQKILKLKNGEVENSLNSYNTFAANIHDLLADEFFLDEGYMGAFAQKQIEQAINILNYIIADKELRKLSVTIKNINLKEQTRLKQIYETEKKLYKERLMILRYWDNEKSFENWNAETAKPHLSELIEIIGEPLIKEKLSSMYNDAFIDNTENEPTKRSNAKKAILQMMQDNNINHEDLR